LCIVSVADLFTPDETRIRYVITEKRVNGFLAQIRDVINGSIEAAEEKLGDVLNILRGAKDARRQAYEQAEAAAAAAESKAAQMRAEAAKKYDEL
jgi:F0F1-type ATP synthase membrane subunit b/b'